MPKIAEAVNAFGSPEVQRRAFDALLAALAPAVNEAPGDRPEEPTPPGSADSAGHGVAKEESSNGSASSADGSKANGRRSRARAPKRACNANKNINWMPSGTVSLKDFAEEKKPSNAGEKNVVIAYYLVEHLNYETFDVSDVLGGYKAAGWPFPGDPANSLQVTASAEHWLDTADMSKIKLLHQGINAVEHELPRAKKK
jgi:hypothetical protein